MKRYIIIRVFQAIICLLTVLIIVFLLNNLTGSPAKTMLPMDATEDQIATMEHELGLDRHILVQFGIFLRKAVTGDFGTSIMSNISVLRLVADSLPNTLLLGGLAMFFAAVIALPIGVYSAVQFRSKFDRLGRAFAILGQSVPTFWVGILFIYIFGYKLSALPISGMGGFKTYIMPAMTLGWWISAGLMRLTRSSMLDTLGADYILLGRAKGLREFVVIWKHAFKNAMIPVLTFGALLLVFALTGSVIVETVFAWPGLGRLAIQAIIWRDYPVVQACVLVLSTLYIFVNLAVDLLYAYINPKIKY
jgi:peptide/nickel transport system permease protein